MFILRGQYSKGVHNDAEIVVDVEPRDRRFFGSSFINSNCYLDKLGTEELLELKTALTEYIPGSLSLEEEKKDFIVHVDRKVHELKIAQDPTYALGIERDKNNELRQRLDEARSQNWRLGVKVDELEEKLRNLEPKEED
jgi:hypothetical protein